VAAIGGGLLAPDVPVSATSPIVVGARSFGGALYVVAVNPTRAAVHATVTAPGLDGRTGTVLDEGRTVKASGDGFPDGFAPLAVHLYVFPPS
jgi:hypothetical protein